MVISRPYRQRLTSSEDLITPYEAIRAGFVALALEKNRRATPLVAQARALRDEASNANSPDDLLRMTEIRPALLTAAAVSDKALNHLQPQDKDEAIRNLIEQFLKPAGRNFVEELVYRFLLTRGDTLGGSMRNLGGALAQRKLTRAIVAALTMARKKYQWQHSTNRAWATGNGDDTDIELHLRALSWTVGRKKRTLVYNLTVPLVKKNVDVCLFDCEAAEMRPNIYSVPARYIALGELKGGIDPAGADEHWKTANSALARIHKAFAKEGLKPHTFFIGAAIERHMAVEIWSQLEEGMLENAANLTNETQLTAIVRWLIGL